jgi:small GTP-binding protein
MLFRKIFLFGIDNAGKTCLSEALRTGSPPETLFPTTTFDVQVLFVQNFEDSIEFRVWDAPGQRDYRDFWGEGYQSANFMIFVLDTTDKERFPEAKEVLERVINDPETAGVPLIFLYHKMDEVAAKANYKDAISFFKLSKIKNREVHAMKSSVNDADSLDAIKLKIGEIVAKEHKVEQ